MAKKSKGQSTAAGTPKFEGFEPPKQNWFKLPRQWSNIVAGITNLAELKVVQYVLTHTWGYAEYGIKKRISIDEFMNGRKGKDGKRIDRGTGLSRQSVISGLQRAVEHGYLEVEKDSKDKARAKHYYGLKMVKSWKEDDEQPDDDPESNSQGSKTLTPGVNELDRNGLENRPRSKKDTLERQQQEREVVVDRLKNLHQELGATEKVKRPTTVAKQLIKQYGMAEQALVKIDEKVRYYRYKRGRGKQIVNPTAWVIDALKTDYSETGFKTQEELEHEQLERKRQREAAAQFDADLEAKREEKRQADEQQRKSDLEKLQESYGTTDREITLWPDVLQDLAGVMPKATYGLHLSSSQLLRLQNGTAVIAVSNTYSKAWVENRLVETVARVLESHLEKPVTPEFVAIANPREKPINAP